MTIKWLSSYAPVDEEFDNVSLLLHGDSTNGSTTVVDSSSSSKTVTAVGDAQISTAQSKFGGSSIKFDGVGDFLTVDSSDFAFGTEDFTVELWGYAAAPHQDYRVLVTSRQNNGGDAGAFNLGVRANGILLLYSNQFNISSSVNAMPVNAWCHIALVRANGSAAIYVNGVSVGTGSFANNVTRTLVGVGDFPVIPNEPFDGYIDDLRITKGVARYTSNFTPPTTPFPDHSSTIPGNIIFQSPASNDPLLDLNTQPSLDLQFATSKTLDDRVSGLPLINHQRDASSGKSAGTYVGSDGLIKTSPVNLLTYSEEFDQANWANRRTTDSITAETLDPLSGSSATKLVDSIDNNTHRIDKLNLPLSESTSYTFSVFAKPAEYSHISLSIGESANFKNASFDIGAGEVVSETNGYKGSIDPVGNGWYRCSATVTLPSSAFNQAALIGLLLDATTTSFAGDGSSGVYIWGAQVEEGTTATNYIPTGGTISGAPRFDHDPLTGASLGLLIEEERTNYILNSNFPVTSNSNSTITDVSGIETPDGNISTVKRHVRSAGLGFDRFGDLGSGSAGTVYTGSVYVRTVSGTETIEIDVVDSPSISYTITENWTRIYASGSAPSNNYRFFDINLSNNDIYIWGAQLEAGSFPTSYIPTTTETVERDGDVISITGTNFSNFYNNSEGTWFTDMALGFTNNAGNPYTFGGVFYTTVARSIRTLSNGTLLAGNSISNSLTVPSKTALAMKPEGYMIANDGVLAPNSYIVTTNSSYVPAGTQLRIAPSLGGLGRISRITYYPYRLADTTLQEITS